MGSHSLQGVGLTVFLLSFVFLALACAGGGILSFVVWVILLGASFAIMRKCKALEAAAE